MSRVDEALSRARNSGSEPVIEPAPPPPPDTPQFPVEPEVVSAPERGQSGSEPDDPMNPVEDPGYHRRTRYRSFANEADKMMLGSGDRDAAEQYRRLAARLYLAQAEHGTKLVMVTSALPGEGKTLTSTNLALTLSESYRKRVLLIDADLRHPSIHELFQVPNLAGLNDGRQGQSDRKVPLIRFSEYLSILTAGRPESDPMSVLTSEHMRRLLKEASASFDWVIIDTPPVALLTDANLLASQVETVVLVVRAGRTPAAAIQKASEAVGRDRILGVVLNYAELGLAHGAYYSANYYTHQRGLPGEDVAVEA